MAAWDRRTAEKSTAAQGKAVQRQVVDAVAPFSPFWRARFAALGRTASSAASLAGLATLPPAGERDVCPDGDPAAAAALVLQAGESGWALHAEGPRLRAALLRRLVLPGSYRGVVERDTRPTSFVWAGLGLRFPVASTRSDLDVVARAGARALRVLGLTPADVLVSALPTLPTALVQALSLGATGTGTPLLSPGPRAAAVADALRLVPASALVLPVATAAELLDELVARDAPLDAVRTVVLAGAPYDDERAAVRTALEEAGLERAALLALHVPDGDRLPWAECRESGGSTGLHTHPDLQVVQGVDPETGESATSGVRELVVTQLGLRGSALLRWRTGDLAADLSSATCSGCGRTVPRAVGVRRGALVTELELRDGARAVDLRAVTSAVSGRPDVADWRVVLGRSGRDGADELLVHVVVADGEDEAETAVGVARDVRVAAGLLPTQVVVEEPGDLPTGERLTARVLL